MSLKDLNLKKAYDSDVDDILNDFYIPALSQAKVYKRLAGFFSSNVLALAARGVSKLISNDGHMYLIVGAKLQKSDIEAIKEAHENPEKIIERTMLWELENLENEFVRDHVMALAWMIVNKKLDIKVAVVCDEKGHPLDKDTVDKEGLFHQKVGIFEDEEGNKISFSGSDNESAYGWVKHIEEFKVFRSWIENEKEYLEADEKKFNKFWYSQARRTKVIEVPEAVKDKLIEIAPTDIESLKLEKWIPKKEIVFRRIRLWSHQERAVQKWLQNNGKGIFEMATGSGKTFAALECVRKVSELERELIVVISSPTKHLLDQWQSEINKFGINWPILIVDSRNPKWREMIVDYLHDIENGIREKLIILTTPNTLSTKEFLNSIKHTDAKLFLIGDEVHTLGAPQRQAALVEKYEFRLGLSATPRRYFDEVGTQKIFDFFGDVVFEFSLKDAITTVNPLTGETYLTPYEYEPRFVEMTKREMGCYLEETKKIARLYYASSSPQEQDDLLRKLLIKRRNIIKNAENKYIEFEKILDELGSDISHCLVYCSPQQIKKVQKILTNRDIRHHKFTAKEDVDERRDLLRMFADGTYQVLVAMKCLDEGVDVPPAKIGILLSSSGNPREFVQRRGRLLRRFPGKEKAILYDIIVLPPRELSSISEVFELEKKILAKEIERYEEFAYDANNTPLCIEKLKNVRKAYDL